jgi:sulfur carrier protein
MSYRIAEDRDVTVADLLYDLGYDRNRVAVEIDGEIYSKALYSEKVVEDGSSFEVVTFVGGG